MFQPFFALIEDGVTNEHHHPTVHYIFSDDDADIITEAGLRSLEQDEFGPESEVSESRHTSGKQPHHQYRPGGAQQQSDSGDDDDRESSKLLPLPDSSVREHYLVIDIAPSASTSNDSTAHGLEVVNAQSLSSEWQVTRTSVTNAPTIDDTPETAEGDVSGGLMLKVEGRAYTPPEEERVPVVGERGERESLEDMVERFQKRLGEIRRTMGLGMGGQPGGGEGGGGVGAATGKARFEEYVLE